jgi:RecB family exonuclease
MKKYKINAIPYQHPELDKWRENFTGIQYLHQKTGLLITGAIDDIWINPKKELHIVDYKSTSTKEEISLESKYKIGYKTQMEIYQWIFKQKGFPVSDIGYFVFANASKERDKFDSKLEFEMSIIEYKGNTDWIENTIEEIADCLNKEEIPKSNQDCEYCKYYELQREHEKNP